MSDESMARSAITELLRLGREYYTSDLVEIFKKMSAHGNRAGVEPAIDFLLYSPLLDGHGASSFPEKPWATEVAAAIDYLVWAGNPLAILALQRVASTRRAIRVGMPYDEWDTIPNDEERARAERAIRTLGG